MLNVIMERHRMNKMPYKTPMRYSDEVSDEENNEIIREFEKLTEYDLEIVKSEMISI
ncbi:MAG: hypothetical protein IJ859_11375 [Synergistaceae bacterium]|nr:hypothetical protein [Synergistaceae bacterium]